MADIGHGNAKQARRRFGLRIGGEGVARRAARLGQRRAGVRQSAFELSRLSALASSARCARTGRHHSALAGFVAFAQSFV